jgi:hypothetical protein
MPWKHRFEWEYMFCLWSFWILVTIPLWLTGIVLFVNISLGRGMCSDKVTARVLSMGFSDMGHERCNVYISWRGHEAYNTNYTATLETKCENLRHPSLGVEKNDTGHAFDWVLDGCYNARSKPNLLQGQ